MDQPELDLRELLHILRRRLWLIVTVPVVAAVVAGAISVFVLQPVYSASTTLWVIKDNTTGQVNYNDVLMSQNLTKTYAEVAKSRTVLAGALKGSHAATDLTVEQLQKKLTVTAVRDTQILSFSVEDRDPVLATKLADGVAESFKQEIVGFMKVENVKIVDEALVPTLPVSPRKTMNVAIAFVLGALAAVGTAFLLELLDTSIKTPDDVTRHLGLPVLGTIPVFEGDSTEPAHRRSRAHPKQSAMVVEK
ncbi:MAG TPA: Wzz/FepE/Etk N-terminal domain-containing protein [Symbiobacteriaceae bacterium]|jgi:capsular polysaccharide biosynthesis protein